MTAQERFMTTKMGISSRIYNNQILHSERRGDIKPSYSLEELRDWLDSKEEYSNIFDEWVLSKFDKYSKPSVDRLDDYKPYSLDNIQVVTWRSNNDKGNTDVINGINTKTSRAVIQLSKDGVFIKEYYSMAEAQRKTGINASKICVVCKGDRKSSGGFIWKYKEI